MTKKKKVTELTDKEAIRRLFPKPIVDAANKDVRETDEVAERREKKLSKVVLK